MATDREVTHPKRKKKRGGISCKPHIMRRFIIAVDGNGVYFRKILYTTFHGETGEITYDAKPLFSTQDKIFKKKLMELVMSLNGA